MSNFRMDSKEWGDALWKRIKSWLSGIETTISSQASAISGKKDTQTAVTDPTASGTSLTFISSITQDAQGVIPPAKKTVAAMAGATSGAAGASGLVPAPASGDHEKYLRGDGTWAVPSGGGGSDIGLYRDANGGLCEVNEWGD